MTDDLMKGMAGLAAIIIAVIIIVVAFLVGVYVRRAVRQATTVARALWWTLGIFAACVVMGWGLVDAGYVASGWYLGAWAFLGLCLTVTGCELYSLRFDQHAMNTPSEVLIDDILHQPSWNLS